MKAIDVSYFQGAIDFKKVKAAGIGAVIIKAGQDNFLDPKFKEYASAATKAGIPFGVYWFGCPTSAADAKAEAKRCIEAIKPYKLSLPIYYDYEYFSIDKYKEKTGSTKNPTKTQVTGFCTAFLGEIKKAGYRGGYYTNPDFLARYVTESKLNGYSKWLAAWGTVQPKNCGDIWQRGVTRVNGISVDVDDDLIVNEKIVENIQPTPEPEPQPEPSTTRPEDVKMRLIKYGSQGEAVKVWQQILACKGIKVGNPARVVSVDGIFGQDTKSATLIFQKAAFPNSPTEWDGSVGDKTWTKGLESIK